MSDNKKYYYLKLKDNFFETDSMIILESMPDGYKYSNILMKLYLKSLKTEGRLMFNDRIPYNPTVLAQITRHSVGDVEKALTIFRDLELIEVLDNGAIYILDIQDYIGKSSSEADRKRQYRQRIEQEKRVAIGTVGTNGQMSGQMSDKHPPELEIEIELDIELEKEKEIDIEKEKIPFKEIIDYLNEKAGKSFKNVETHKKLIRARWNEGQHLDDFKKVVDNMVANWTGKTFDGKPAETYLQPSTLFGNKFDQYLNQVPKAEEKEVIYDDGLNF
ncbi:phage replisome organizer N-terminal domain-containing protein [Carnobacterium maltaromaticum]|uniref:phage replisome organizer N-terminal domain-containing protein n=1 Tax=Carnobacterium maltaromaticum TaxID=2751 RepID=UPI0039B0BBF6